MLLGHFRCIKYNGVLADRQGFSGLFKTYSNERRRKER